MTLDDLRDALKFEKIKVAYFELPTTINGVCYAESARCLTLALMDIIIGTGFTLSPGS